MPPQVDESQACICSDVAPEQSSSSHDRRTLHSEENVAQLQEAYAVALLQRLLVPPAQQYTSGLLDAEAPASLTCAPCASYEARAAEYLAHSTYALFQKIAREGYPRAYLRQLDRHPPCVNHPCPKSK